MSIVSLRASSTGRLARTVFARGLATAHNDSKDVVFVSFARTPIGSFGGKLSSVSGVELGSVVIKEAISRAGVKAADIGEVMMGNVIGAGMKQAPTRQAAIAAGLPTSVVTTGINKVCASGMKAITLASQTLALGNQSIMVAGGMESMSNVPYYLLNGRNGFKYGHQQVLDGVLYDGLTDVYNNFHMGNCAENTNKKFGITRQEQDAYAIASYARAADAWKGGRFKDEVVPVSVPQKKGDPEVVSEDENYKNIKADKVPTLKPVFDKHGSVTAANASTLK